MAQRALAAATESVTANIIKIYSALNVEHTPANSLLGC